MKQFKTVSSIASDYDGAGHLFLYGYDKDFLLIVYRNAFEMLSDDVSLKNEILERSLNNLLSTQSFRR